MKRILEACIKQRIQFDNRREMYIYIGKLRERKIDHKCISHTENPDGTMTLLICKAYNGNALLQG